MLNFQVLILHILPGSSLLSSVLESRLKRRSIVLGNTVYVDVLWRFNIQHLQHYMTMCQLLYKCAVHASEVVRNILKLVK
jgi:hypothetical protein